MNKPKIAVIHSKSGCCFWRAWQPAEFMRKQGLAEIRYLDTKTMTSKDIAEALQWCDIASARGLIGTDGLALLRNYQRLGKPVAIDYDDLHFNVSPFNPAYRHFGLENVQVKDPVTGEVTYLWEDGKNGFDIRSNEIKFHSYKALLKEANLVTTTTLYLHNALQDVAEGQGNIRIVPNAIDFQNWKPMPEIREKFPQKFRFGWAVSNSHGEDWLFIRSVLKEFLEKHSDATFVCIGDTSMDIRAGLPAGQVEWYPFSDLWEYHYPMRMAMLGLDVAIAPLADTEFNRCKSPLKWAEYTALGWPVIAQDMTPYKEEIIQGETGLLAGTHEQWLTCLESLYSNPDLRAKLRFNATFAVRSIFDLEKVAKEWQGVYAETILGAPNEQLITSVGSSSPSGLHDISNHGTGLNQ